MCGELLRSRNRKTTESCNKLFRTQAVLKRFNKLYISKVSLLYLRFDSEARNRVKQHECYPKDESIKNYEEVEQKL